MAILNLFPVPLYKINDTNIITVEEKKLIKDVFDNEGTHSGPGDRDRQIDANPQHQISNNSYVLDVNGLEQAKQKILNHVKKFVEEILSPKNDNDMEFYITQSWVNIHSPGSTGHRFHTHPNSIVSGIFYIKTLSKDSIFVEHHDNQMMPGHAPALDFEPCKRTQYNSRQSEINIQTNDIVIFPSWLPHFVFIKKEDGLRISLAFNTFVKGPLGSSIGFNELKCTGSWETVKDWTLGKEIKKQKY